MNETPQVPGEDAHWQYQQSDAPAMTHPEDTEIRWTASEFVAHEKGVSWYALFLLGAVLFAAIPYFLTHDVVSTGLVLTLAVILVVAANRKPRVLDYTVSDRGLLIGQKPYSYTDFKSFSIVKEGAFSSIMLMPLKRFMPPISIYYEPQDEERIVQVIATYLPHENHHHDMFDQLVDRLHF